MDDSERETIINVYPFAQLVIFHLRPYNNAVEFIPTFNARKSDLTLPLVMTVRQVSKGFIIALFGAVLLCLMASVQAVEVSGLYRVELPVESQSREERKRASGAALERVIQRITGDTAAFNEPVVQVALRAPERYLRQFSYFQDDSTDQQFLRLLFDQSLLNRLLRQAKQPIWGDNRPSLMMWVAVEGAGERSLISAAEDSIWQSAVKRAGQDSGVPILLPLMDLQDESSISVMDVWGLFRGKLEEASLRYRSEAVLGGRLYQQAPEQWAGRWLLVFNGEAVSFTTSPTTMENSASEALAQVANIMVERYAIDTTAADASQIKLAVQGVKTLQDYARVQAYLKGFAMVHNVAVSHVEGERLTLALSIEGEWSKLKDLIALDKKLQPESDAVMEFSDGLMVIPYLWRP